MISELIDFLHLPPNQSSLNLFKQIKSITHSHYITHYLHINNQYLLISSFDFFKTLSNPNILHLKYFPTLSSLNQFLSTLK